MSDNILLVSEDKSFLSGEFSKLSVFKRNPTFERVSLSDVKKISLSDFEIILVNSGDYSEDKLFKILNLVKKELSFLPVLFLNLTHDENILHEFYNNGMFDYLSPDFTNTEFEIKILNCLKFITLMNFNKVLIAFQDASNPRLSKSNLYSYKALKEVFDSLVEYECFKNSAYVILTIDSSSRTKVSINRLAQILRKHTRKTDIIAKGFGKFYLMLPDTDLKGAKSFIEKISDLMGREHNIRSGICQVVFRTFDEVDKLANDSLKSSFINNELYMCLGDNYCTDEDLIYPSRNDNGFKLFKILYVKKLKTIIEPLFYRLANEFSSKYPNISVCQYANDIECMFSLRFKNYRSELIMRYNGFTKLNVNIIHEGLDTPDNNDFEISLKKLDDDYISGVLIKFYKDFLDIISADYAF